MGYSSFSGCKPRLAVAFEKENWFNVTVSYFHIRYHPIEERLSDALRYVELAPENSNTFSYEFGSILRDIGSAFSSILDNLVKNTTTGSTKILDISHYLKFLSARVDNINLIGVELISSFTGSIVFPFYNIKNEEIKPKKRLTWWVPYNNIKHSEINNIEDGCLANVIYGMASLAILYRLMVPPFRSSIVFSSVGFFKPMDKIETFPTSERSS